MKPSMQLPFSAVGVVVLPALVLARFTDDHYWWAAIWLAVWIRQCWLLADSFKKVRRAEGAAK